MIKLTELETKAVALIAKGHVDFFEAGFVEDSDGWIDCYTDNVVHYLSISAQAAGGVISSMIQKKVFNSSGGAIFLTQAGIDAYTAAN